MASFKGYHKKKQASKLGMVISGLRKENASLKKTLAEMTDQHSKHNKLIEVNFPISPVLTLYCT